MRLRLPPQASGSSVTGLLVRFGEKLLEAFLGVFGGVDVAYRCSQLVTERLPGVFEAHMLLFGEGKPAFFLRLVFRVESGQIIVFLLLQLS